MMTAMMTRSSSDTGASHPFRRRPDVPRTDASVPAP
jgi:hypothetical protein